MAIGKLLPRYVVGYLAPDVLEFPLRQLELSQPLALGRLSLRGFGAVDYITYWGPTTRRDFLVNATADVAFQFVSIFSAALSYNLNFRGSNTGFAGVNYIRHEPALGLFAGPDGLELIRDLVPAAAARAPWLALELGAGQADAVEAFMREAGYGHVERHRDLAGIERVLVATR